MIRPNPMDKKTPTLDGLAGPVGCESSGASVMDIFVPWNINLFPTDKGLKVCLMSEDLSKVVFSFLIPSEELDDLVERISLLRDVFSIG